MKSKLVLTTLLIAIIVLTSCEKKDLIDKNSCQYKFINESSIINLSPYVPSNEIFYSGTISVGSPYKYMESTWSPSDTNIVFHKFELVDNQLIFEAVLDSVDSEGYNWHHESKVNVTFNTDFTVINKLEAEWEINWDKKYSYSNTKIVAKNIDLYWCIERYDTIQGAYYSLNGFRKDPSSFDIQKFESKGHFYAPNYINSIDWNISGLNIYPDLIQNPGISVEIIGKTK